MVFTSVRLQNYRSYIDSSFEFNPNINVIVGPNASGKTNLLDALYLISTGTPTKNNKEHLINNHQDWARIDVLTTNNEERTVRLVKEENITFDIDDKRYNRLSLDKKLPIVLFEPNQLYRVTTSPEQRRLFIDDILVKIDKEYTGIKNKYIQTLRQRNNLLKQHPSNIEKQIFVWDIRLCELANEIIKKRKELINKINQRTSEIYSQIAGFEHQLLLQYESKIDDGDNYNTKLLKYLQNNLVLDKLRGFTSQGPHRDDISISIDTYDMRGVASRGETRSILLSLKVIESQLLEEIYKTPPMLLLDDVFGELDGLRRKSLIKLITHNQTFITTTDADIISHDFTQSTQLHLISK